VTQAEIVNVANGKTNQVGLGSCPRASECRAQMVAHRVDRQALTLGKALEVVIAGKRRNQPRRTRRQAEAGTQHLVGVDDAALGIMHEDQGLRRRAAVQ